VQTPASTAIARPRRAHPGPFAIGPRGSLTYKYVVNAGSYFDRHLVLLDIPGADLHAVLAAAAASFAVHEGYDRQAVEDALHQAATEGASVTIGAGVAIPHARFPIAAPRVVVVRTREPIALRGADNQPVDLFFVTLAPHDQPREHLLLLAHVARLMHSRLLLDSLRSATTADEVIALIEAAELRHQLTTENVLVAAAPVVRELVVVEMVGERAVDRLLVDLADAGLADAVAVDGQPVRDLMASELPLFAGFRDLFGDPAGTRIFLVTVPADRTEHILELVKNSCEQSGCPSARVAVMPLRHYWEWKQAEPAGSKGH
jgi:mannitol/fructose-specific phosphotransferase system IIA component (Ntr-type)